MDISSVNSDLIRGNVTTIILGCLVGSDRYGYEILKEIEDRSVGHYSLKQATLYNQLKRLEKQGLVYSYDGDPDDTGGGQRRYYGLTPEGLAYLKKESGEYEYARTILDRLVSDREFDFSNPTPFDASELRPYSKREQGPAEEKPAKPKIIYRDRLVEVEKTVFLDRHGNPVSESDAGRLAQEAADQEDRIRQLNEELATSKEWVRVASEELEEARQQAKEYEEQLSSTREHSRLTEEQLEQVREEESSTREKLALAEMDIARRDEALRAREEEIEQMREQLRATEAGLEETRNKLQALEEAEARRAEQERLRREEEARRLAEEEERRREEQARPSSTVEEMFAKLEAESEYDGNAPAYINSEESLEEGEYSSLESLYRRLNERAAEVDSRLAAEQAEREREEEMRAEEQRRLDEEKRLSEEAAADGSPTATLNREDGFAYEQADVNYRDFFYNITEQPEQVRKPEAAPAPAPAPAATDIKTRLYAKGYYIRSYDRGTTSEYYTFNFLQANRLNKDAFLLVLALFLAEIAVLWVSLYSRISYAYFLPITLAGVVICLIPTVVYLINPSRRIRDNYNFKLSLLNRSMLFIELTLVCILIGFFALGASVNDIDLILCSIVIPAILLLNLPLSAVFYWLLYRTRKYHIS